MEDKKVVIVEASCSCGRATALSDISIGEGRKAERTRCFGRVVRPEKLRKLSGRMR